MGHSNSVQDLILGRIDDLQRNNWIFGRQIGGVGEGDLQNKKKGHHLFRCRFSNYFSANAQFSWAGPQQLLNFSGWTFIETSGVALLYNIVIKSQV